MAEEEKETENTEDVEEQEEKVSESNSKKKNFLQTNRGSKLAAAVVGLVALAVIFLVQGPAEPLVFNLPPLRAIGVISIILSLFITLIYKFMTDQVLMRELKKQLKTHQKQMKEARSDPSKVSEISKKSMEVNMKYMSQSMKPMLVTIIPFILIFNWLRGVYDSTIVLPLFFWPGHLGWIGTYIIFSMIFTTVLRKMLNVV